jgi:hypothetical protein
MTPHQPGYLLHYHDTSTAGKQKRLVWIFGPSIDRPAMRSQFHADTQQTVPEPECLPSKPLVGAGSKLFTWFLVQCTITRASVKYTSRWNMALDLRANNTDSWTLMMGPIGCSETSVVRNYHYSLRNNPENRSSQYGHTTCFFFTLVLCIVIL